MGAAEGECLQAVASQYGLMYSTVRRPDGEVLLRLHGRVDFEIAADYRLVRAWTDPECKPEMLALLVVGNLVAMILALRGETVLHASAVEVDGRAIAFVAHSGMGKSTLAALACARGDGIPRERWLRAEQRQLERADIVAAVSPLLQERYAAYGREAALVPNGCDPDMYAAADSAPWSADVHLAGPIAGLMGHIGRRVDLALLEAVADTGCSLLLIGPWDPSYEPIRFPALVARPNVCWVGPKALAELPACMRIIDVGLTPYADSDLNRSSFPLKTLEYIAAGSGVVSRDVPTVSWLKTDHVTVARSPAEFTGAVRRQLMVPRSSSLVTHRRRVAEQHSWDRRAATLTELLELEAVPEPAAVAFDGGRLGGLGQGLPIR